MLKIVLIADNSADFLQLMNVVLTDQGYEVVLCPESRHVFPSVRRVRPHVIILDLILAGFTGWQVIDQLKSDPATASIPVIVCTGSNVTAAERGRLKRLDCSLLPKPFELDELFAMLERTISNSSAM